MGTESITITVRGGATDRPEVELQGGTPVEAFSVGTEGSWRVIGPGLEPTHAYLFFDGTTLFVASAGGAKVSVERAAVTTDWSPVPMPSEIRLGGVGLRVRLGRAPEPAARPKARPAAGRPATSKPAHDFDNAPTRDGPLAYGEEDGPDSKTVVQDVPGFAVESPQVPAYSPPQEPPRARGERPKPPSVRPPVESTGGATVIKPLEEFLAETGGAAGLLQLPEPPPQGAQGVIIQPPEPTMPPTGHALWAAHQAMAERGIQPPPGMPLGTPPDAAGAPVFPMPGMQPGTPMQPGMPPGMPPGAPAAPLDKAKQALATGLAQWKELPLPRRLMYGALPFGLLAFMIVFMDDPQPKPRRTSTPQATSAAAKASAAPSAKEPSVPLTPPTTAPPEVPTAAPPGTPPTPTHEPPPDRPKLARGEVTTERKAADAVAAGDERRALELYESLAKDNPDNPAYKEAARILRRRISPAP